MKSQLFLPTRFLLLLVFALLSGCGDSKNTPDQTADKEVTSQKSFERSESGIKDLVDSELLILELTKQLKYLNRDAKNLAVPGVFSKKLFTEEVEFDSLEMDGDSQPDYWQAVSGHGSHEFTKVANSQFQLWPAFFDSVRFFSHVKFYFVSGEYDPVDRGLFHAHMGFKSIAKNSDGKWKTVQSKLDVDWICDEGADPVVKESWKISKFAIKKWKERETQELLFEECLDEMCGPELAAKMRYSQHFEFMAELVGTGRLSMPARYGKYFSPGQTVQHPGASIVDINNDGWDDIYICDEWTKNKLLINKQGEGFYEAAEEYGLDIDLPATSAIFADFDNDGDKDAFIGRCYDRSVLMINDDGIFYDRTEQNVLVDIPMLVTSVAANDFNKDGLIDLYVSTYGYASGNVRFKDWVKDFLTPSDQERYFKLLKDQHRFLSAFGPSNLLLQNVGGGRFTVAVQNQFIDHNHNTFQSVWTDYDGDGDQDLYVSNDYAQDFLYRNDGDKFTDVTFEVGGKDMLGFGMGAGWGDYDADGDLDLYVSNMYSKAGTRILKQIPDLDQRFNLTANGNRLYQQTDGKLVCLPGSDENAAKAGWSWGGKFTDFDNDGLLDIYVGSGYLTSPFDDEQIEDL